MRNDAGWGRRISKETTTHGFFAEKVKNKAGQTRGKRDCMKYAYVPRTVLFWKKVKIKVGGGTMWKTKRGARKNSEKSRKKEQKKCCEKTKPLGMIRGELFTVFSYLRSCGSLSSIGNAGSSAVGGLVVLFAAGSEAKNSHKSCECKCDVLFHFVFPPNENIEYVCVFSCGAVLRSLTVRT